MRLSRVEHKHRLPQKLMLTVMRVIIGRRTPDVLRTLLYRPELFGKPFAKWVHVVMRGPSDWSIGQRELFAAFTSHLNQCPYCIGDHSATAAAALHDLALVQAVLTDWHTAATLDAKTRATLGFLEKLTLAPQTVTPQDVTDLRAAGIRDAAIEDAIHICAIFNIFNRLADALEFECPSPEGFARHGQILLKFGYRF
jgi:uncharacterized peroxidase-related enzyme